MKNRIEHFVETENYVVLQKNARGAVNEKDMQCRCVFKDWRNQCLIRTVCLENNWTGCVLSDNNLLRNILVGNILRKRGGVGQERK